MYLLIILPWSTKNFGVTWCTLIRDWLTIDNLRKISSFQKLLSFPCVWMADSFRNPRECLGAAQFFTVAMSEHYHMLPFLCISFKYPLEALLLMNPCGHVTPSLETVYSPPAAQTFTSSLAVTGNCYSTPWNFSFIGHYFVLWPHGVFCPSCRFR